MNQCQLVTEIGGMVQPSFHQQGKLGECCKLPQYLVGTGQSPGHSTFSVFLGLQAENSSLTLKDTKTTTRVWDPDLNTVSQLYKSLNVVTTGVTLTLPPRAEITRAWGLSTVDVGPNPVTLSSTCTLHARLTMAEPRIFGRVYEEQASGVWHSLV